MKKIKLKSSFLLLFSIMYLTVIGQGDTMKYLGEKIVEKVQGEWISNNVEYIPTLKVCIKSDTSIYLHLQVENNLPIINGEVKILTNTDSEFYTTYGLLSNGLDPYVLRIFKNSDLLFFYFDPDFDNKIMKSYLIMNKI